MEEKEEIKRGIVDWIGDNYYRWSILVGLYLINNEDFLTIKKICKRLHVPRNSPSFNEILGKLVESELIEIKDIVGQTHLLDIKHKKLLKVITKCPTYEVFIKIQEKAKPNTYIIA